MTLEKFEESLNNLENIIVETDGSLRRQKWGLITMLVGLALMIVFLFGGSAVLWFVGIVIFWAGFIINHLATTQTSRKLGYMRGVLDVHAALQDDLKTDKKEEAEKIMDGMDKITTHK